MKLVGTAEAERRGARFTKRGEYEGAVHEAAHAIVARHYGFEFPDERAMVWEGTEGAVHATSCVTESVHAAVVAAAGVAAEMMLARLQGNLADAFDMSDEDAAGLAFALGAANLNDLPDALVGRFVVQATGIIERRWSAVETLAKALLDKRALGSGDIERAFAAEE